MSLRVESISAGYGAKQVLDHVTVDIPPGEFTVIVGPNACGKSTLLRVLARLIKPSTGQVLFGTQPIHTIPTKEIARRLALLPQNPVAPEAMVVEELVRRGRYPHQGIIHQWSRRDQDAVDEAMQRADVLSVKDRALSDLSGGQRQRVWLAMVLAQETDIILLDEPTTYLDITHQVEVLDLAAQLQQEGRTIVAVLHELSLAFRYATNLVVMKDGQIRAEGKVTDIVTEELLKDVYELDCQLLHDPLTHTPIVVPVSRLR